jgi:hypothetical protein
VILDSTFGRDKTSHKVWRSMTLALFTMAGPDEDQILGTATPSCGAAIKFVH